MKREIATFVIEKGFYNKPEEVPKKLPFALIELREAADAWKKRIEEQKIAEELIEVILHFQDSSRIACPSVDMDQAFRNRLEKTKGEYQYSEGHRLKPYLVRGRF
jgi:hypothetical protein